MKATVDEAKIHMVEDVFGDGSACVLVSLRLEIEAPSAIEAAKLAGKLKRGAELEIAVKTDKQPQGKC